MLSVTQLSGESLQEDGEAVLQALAARDGFVRGSLGRATDDPTAWVLVTEWASVGAYRRALGGYDVKVAGAPFFAHAADQPSAFEVLVSSEGAAATSDRAAGGLGRAGS